jgi:hypothetical protein
VPVQTRFLEGTVECHPMAITLGIRERPVDIEKQGLQLAHRRSP